MAHQLISRRVLATGTAGAVALCVAAVGAVPASATPEPAGHGRGAAGPERSVAAALRLMSTQEKVGQLFTQNVYGSDATTPDARNLPLYGVASPAEVVRKYHLGGVIYFAWTDSVKDPAQITALSNGLQRAAIGSGAHIPLTVGTDQEQGVVTRVGPPATQFPGSMALGASRSTADARTAAAITGRELKAMGINVDYAPDADVNVNPLNPVIGTRSFSSDPALVSVDGVGPGHRLPEGRRDRRHAQALPGPRRHRHRQPHRHPGDHAHQGAVAADRRPSVPGRHQRRRRHDHERAPRGAGAGPLR